MQHKSCIAYKEPSWHSPGLDSGMGGGKNVMRRLGWTAKEDESSSRLKDPVLILMAFKSPLEADHLYFQHWHIIRYQMYSHTVQLRLRHFNRSALVSLA